MTVRALAALAGVDRLSRAVANRLAGTLAAAQLDAFDAIPADAEQGVAAAFTADR